MSMHQRLKMHDFVGIPTLAYIEELCRDGIYFRATE